MKQKLTAEGVLAPLSVQRTSHSRSFSEFLGTSMLLRRRNLPATVSLPVWVVSRNSEQEPTKVFKARQFWANPAMVEYSKTSFEVIEDCERIKERRTGQEEPNCWCNVEWRTVADNCFDKDPRILSKFKTGNPPAPFPPEDVQESETAGKERTSPGVLEEADEVEAANCAPDESRSTVAFEQTTVTLEVPRATSTPREEPVEEQANASTAPVHQPISQMPDLFAAPMPDLFEGHQPLPDMFAATGVGAPPPSKKPKRTVSKLHTDSELLTRLKAFAFEQGSVLPPASQVASGIFKGSSVKGLELQRAVQHVRCFTPEGSMKAQRNAMRRLLELLDFVPELDAEALKDPERAGELMEVFLVARAGIPQQTPASWRPVKPLTALNEVFLISTALAHAGLPKPSMASINAAAKKLGAHRAKKATSPKTPLTFQHLETLWRSHLMASPVDLRNIAMFAIGFFFLLRGINVRELRRRDLSLDADSQSWRVFIDHQKNDPLILGQEGTAQGAIQWAGNPLLDEILKAWMQVASAWAPEAFLFPASKVTAPQIVCWKGKENRFDPTTGLTSSQHLNEWIQKSLKTLRPLEDVSKLTFHSARVGGATAIFASTHNEALVRKMGNWRSEAFRTYIIISVQEVIETTSKIGQAPLQGEPELLIQ